MTADECRAAVLAAEAAYDETVLRIRSKGGAFEAHPEIVFYHQDVVHAAQARDRAIEAAQRAYYAALEAEMGL